MYSQGVLRLILLCILAAQIRSVQAEEIELSAPYSENMGALGATSTERRRSWLSNKLNHHKKKWKKKREKKLRKCREACFYSSLSCGDGEAIAICYATCIGICYVKYHI